MARNTGRGGILCAASAVPASHRSVHSPSRFLESLAGCRCCLVKEEADMVLSCRCFSPALTATTQLNRKLPYPAAAIPLTGGLASS